MQNNNSSEYEKKVPNNFQNDRYKYTLNVEKQICKNVEQNK